MYNQIYPTDLTDGQWHCIKDLIPPAKVGGRPRTLDMLQVINAILYVVVGGIQWRMLPTAYPAWKSVYHYFRQWRDDGTWRRMHDTLRAAVRRQAGRHYGRLVSRGSMLNAGVMFGTSCRESKPNYPQTVHTSSQSAMDISFS